MNDVKRDWLFVASAYLSVSQKRSEAGKARMRKLSTEEKSKLSVKANKAKRRIKELR